MKRLYQLLVIAVLTMAFAATAMAQGAPEGAQLSNHLYMDYNTGLLHSPPPAGTNYVGDVYNNTGATSIANGGFSATDLAGIWGDELLTIGTGILDQLDFTIYNSGSSAGTLSTVAYTLALYDGGTLANVGAFNTSVVSVALAKGYYTIMTVTGLSSLNIPIGSDVIVTQKVLSHTGTANRLGIVSLDPPSIGSSANTLYISNTTSPAGWYTSGTINANVGYRLSTVNSTPTQSTTWGKLKSLYR